MVNDGDGGFGGEPSEDIAVAEDIFGEGNDGVDIATEGIFDPTIGAEEAEGDGDEYEDEDGDGHWADQMDVDDDTREFLSKWDSPEQALRAARERDLQAGRQSEEVGSTRQEIAELRAQVQALTQAPQRQEAQSEGQSLAQQFPAYKREVMAAMADGRLDEQEGIDLLLDAQQKVHEEYTDKRVSELIDRVESDYGSRLETAEVDRWENQQRTATRAVRQEYGDDLFRELAPDAQKILRERVEANPGLTNDQKAIKAAFDSAFASKQLRERRMRAADVANGGAGGGRGPARIDPAKAIVDEIDALGGGLGNGGFS